MADEAMMQHQSVGSGGLLAVDLGLRMGLAYFDGAAQLRWYRSQHVGKRAQLKGAIWSQLMQLETLSQLVLEGDRQLAQWWERAARKRFERVEVICIGAEQWRSQLLIPRQQRSGKDAKASAIELARELILESAHAPNPTALRHDTAEAILIGAWGCQRYGLVQDKSVEPSA